VEPAKTALKINYVVHTTVKRLEAIGPEPNTQWFAQFEGSWESLCFGAEHPQFSVGDKIKITFERIDDAQPSQPSI
jgi:hypothetical protein